MASTWAEATDENGTVYYINEATGETSWINPEVAAEGQWVEQHDGEGNIYYMHSGTYETRWDRPAEMDLQESSSLSVEATEAIAVEVSVEVPAEEIKTAVAEIKANDEEPIVSIDSEVAPTIVHPIEIGKREKAPSPKNLDNVNTAVETSNIENSDDVTAEMQEKMIALQNQLKEVDPEIQAKIDDANRAQELATKNRDEAVESGAELWVEVYDPETDSFYYYGSYSHDITWDQPEDYVMAVDDELMNAVIKIQCTFRARLARKKVQSTREIQIQKWVEATHDDGTIYYYNTETNEAQATMPNTFKPGATPDETIIAKMKKTLEGKVRKVDPEIAAKVKKAKDESEKTAAQLKVRWVSVFDPATEAFYFYDPDTANTTWDQPDEFVESADDETMTAVIKIQCAFRGKMAKRRTKEQRLKLQLQTEKEQEAAAVEEKKQEIKKATEVKLGSTKAEVQEKALQEKKKKIGDMNTKEEQMRKELEELKKRKEEKKRIAREERIREEEAEKKRAEEEEKSRLKLERENEKKKKEDDRIGRLEQKRIENENRAAEKKRAVEEMKKQQEEKIQNEMKAREEAKLQRIRDQQMRDARRQQAREQEKQSKAQQIATLKNMYAESCIRCTGEEEEISEWKAACAIEFENKTAPNRGTNETHEGTSQVYWDAIHYSKPFHMFKDIVEHSIAEPEQNIHEIDLQLRKLNKRYVQTEVKKNRAVRVLELKTQLQNGLVSRSPSVVNIDATKARLQRYEAIVLEHQSRQNYLKSKMESDICNDIMQHSVVERQQHIVSLRDDEGNTLLHEAAWNGCPKKVQYLLSLGADINSLDSTLNRCTPLHEAVRGQHPAVVELLLSAGARVDIQDRSGDLPLHLACRNSHRKIAYLLLNADWNDLNTYRTRNYKNRFPQDLARRGPICQLLKTVQSEIEARETLSLKKRQKEELKLKSYRKKQRKGMVALQRHIHSIKTLQT